nr:hypothetical protein [Pandoravirus massiliensis]
MSGACWTGALRRANSTSAKKDRVGNEEASQTGGAVVGAICPSVCRVWSVRKSGLGGTGTSRVHSALAAGDVGMALFVECVLRDWQKRHQAARAENFPVLVPHKGKIEDWSRPPSLKKISTADILRNKGKGKPNCVARCATRRTWLCALVAYCLFLCWQKPAFFSWSSLVSVSLFFPLLKGMVCCAPPARTGRQGMRTTAVS